MVNRNIPSTRLRRADLPQALAWRRGRGLRWTKNSTRVNTRYTLPIDQIPGFQATVEVYENADRPRPDLFFDVGLRRQWRGLTVLAGQVATSTPGSRRSWLAGVSTAIPDRTPRGSSTYRREPRHWRRARAGRRSCRASSTKARSGSGSSRTRCPPSRRCPRPRRPRCGTGSPAGRAWGTDPIDPYQVTTSRRAGRDWWSLQPVRRPQPPAVRRAGWVRTPIDAFVLQKLEASGLAPAPEAEKRQLIRRLSFDLTGLPPTPEEVDAFLNDTSPDAYERLVDRYLASPQYGVRWARWWLDLARYGESNGFEFDEFRPTAWRYRDWVVDALNRDRPYDEFARLQLAGDVLRPDDPEAVEATGFLVAGAYDTAGQNQQSLAMKAVVRSDELEDIIGTVSQTFLGLTVNCARCHDHKFDPVRQVEYYQIASALSGVRHGERDLSEIDPETVAVEEANRVAPGPGRGHRSAGAGSDLGPAQAKPISRPRRPGRHGTSTAGSTTGSARSRSRFRGARP